MINLFDTAGIRESSDEVESIGIEKSISKLKDSDIVLCVFDSQEYDDEDKEITKLVEGKNTIFVYNKKDLVQNNLDDKLYVSALNKDVEPLKKAIIEKLGLSKENYDNP